MKRLLSVFLIFIFLLNSSMIATATETAVPPTSEAAPAMGDGTEEELENGITPWITPSTSYIPAREPIDDGYMTVDEGVYYIKYNAENLYMSVSGSTGSNNSSFYLDSKSSPGLYQLWKLAYWGNGYYSIHPLNRINSAIAYVGGLFLGDSGAPEEVSEMSDAFLWEISYADEYFTIRNYACITTGLGVTGTRVHNDSSAESWTLEEPTTVPEGLVLHDTDDNFIAPGEYRGHYSMGVDYSYYFGQNQSYYREWSSGNSSIASVNATTGVVTGVSPGTTSIYLTVTNEEGVSFTQSYSITVLDLPIGTYTLINKGSKLFANVADHALSVGTTVDQAEFDNSAYQKWVFSHLGDGYYAIKSAASSTTNYYLSIQNNSSNNGGNAILKAGPVTDFDPGMRWKISKQSNGTYKIMPQTGEEDNFYLTPATASDNSAIRLEQRNDMPGDAYYQWAFYEPDNIVGRIKVLYDQAYMSLYQDYTSRICSYLQQVHNYYVENVGIYWVFEAPVSYTSHADTCPSLQSNGICGCDDYIEGPWKDACNDSTGTSDAELEVYHHTNASNILYHMPALSQGQIGSLAFIGNNVCYHDKTGNHMTDNMLYGLAASSIKTAIIMNRNGTTKELITTAHEMGHLIGALDHYDAVDNYTTEELNGNLEKKGILYRFSDACIYGGSNGELDEITMCEGCQALIRGDLEKSDVLDQEEA